MRRKSALLGVFLLLVSSTPAAAYLDSGTASMVLQAFVAGFAVVLVSFRHYLSKIKNFFTGGKTDSTNDEK